MSQEQIAVPKTNPFNLINTVFLALLLIVVMVADIVMDGAHIPTWPAFMVMIFFFFAHGDLKAAPAILIGGAFGIFNMVIISAFIPAAAPILFGSLSIESAYHTKLIYICLFIGSIVYLKDLIPWVFNNYAFMLFTVSGAVNAGNTAASGAAKAVAGAAAKAVSGNPEAVTAINAATAAASKAAVPIANYWEWMAVYVGVGAIFVACIVGIFKVAGAMTKAKAAKGTGGML